MLKIEVADEGYQLVGPEGEESGVVDYGETAELELDGVVYFTTLEDPEEAEDVLIYRLVDGHPEPVAEDHEVEEVEFELETEEEDEEEGDEEEGDEAPAA